MPEHCGEKPLRVITGQGKGIGMAYTRMGDFDQHFARTRRLDVDLDNFKGFLASNATAARDFTHFLLIESGHPAIKTVRKQ